MRVTLLGPPGVDGGEGLRPRERAVLVALAIRRGQAVSADQVAEALWGEDPPPTWAKQVQICVARLRKALGPSAIETTTGGYRLVVDGDDLDVCQFEQLVDRGRALAGTGEPDRAVSTFRRALALWRGNPFEDLDGWAPARSEAARLVETHRSAEEDLLDAQLAAGEHRDVAAAAETLTVDEPLRERRWAILALAQYRCGRQADALRSLQRARRTLVEQLGIDPGGELLTLEAAILRQDEALDAVPEPTPVGDACPYKGLAPYDVADSESFFGRDGEVTACLARLSAAPLLVVAGPSGCGKSSLVRAGLVPALGRQGRTAVVFTPGADPEGAFANASASTSGTPVLVIDQFEELFALGCPIDVVRSFGQRIAAYATERAPVVLAVRSDHLGGLSVDPAMSRLTEQGLHLVSPLAGEALREAIEHPARQAGLRLQDGLTDLLVRDTEGEPGALPLLSHALAETWARRDGHVLTVEGYRSSGGIRAAVARSAERLYENLPLGQRPLLRSVLLRLVAGSSDGDPVRCRVPSSHLLGDPGRERVVTLLVRSRLVTSEADTFELAHEALAKAWPRLQSWLDDDAAGQRILRHLGTAAAGWHSLGRPASELYRGARLDAALEWRETADPDLTDLECDFLQASVAQAATESRAIAERARRDARQNRRLRGLLVAAALFLVVSLAAGLLAVHGRRDAEREGRVATARELAAAANANLDIDPERSILLALAALDHTRSADGTVLPEAREALHNAMAASRIELRVPEVGGRVDWSPRGDVFVTEGPEDSGLIDIRDARTGASVRSWDGHDPDINDVAFNPDGTLLATTGDDGAARIWDPSTGEQLHAVDAPGGGADEPRPVLGPSFSSDGSLFAAAWPDENVVRIIDLTAGDVTREIDSVPGPNGTAFDPGGQRLAVSSAFEPLSAAVVIDLTTGDQVLSLQGHDHALQDVSWSPDGNSIATAGVDGSARVFNAGTGHQRFTILGHQSHIIDVDWSPDSSRIVTASEDGTAKVWQLNRGAAFEVASLSAHDSRHGMRGAAFSPDGRRVISGNVDGTVTMAWDVSMTGNAEIANLPTVMLFYPSAAFTADSQHVVATGSGGSLTVWDAATFTGVRTLDTQPTPSASPAPRHPSGDPPVGTDATDFTTLDTSSDGRFVAALSLDGTLEVLDITTGQRATTVAGTGDFPRVLDWSREGQLLAFTDRLAGAPVIRIVDPRGQEVAVLREEPGVAITSVAFTSDGDQLLTTRIPVGPSEATAGEVVTWDWRTGRAERTLDTPAVLARPSPTDDLIATTSGTEVADVWNTATGRHVTSLAEHTGTVLNLAFSPDGTQLATASVDGTVRVWNPHTGEQLAVLDGHIGLVSDVSFNPDGTQLASASADGSVRIWALDLDELIDLAENEITRTLTDAECQRYLHTERCPHT